jgi:hypothetical protein
VDGTDDVETAIDGAMWWPDYVPYRPLTHMDRRRRHVGA